MNSDEIDFYSDKYNDVAAMDERYAARGYALVMDVINFLLRGNENVSDYEILDEFKERTLDQYGPMAYTVLDEWGIHSCRDVGNMVENLATCHRIKHSEGDDTGAFDAGYDFKEVFLGPYDL